MMGRCLQCPVLSPAAVVRLPAGGGGRADSEALPASVVSAARRTCPGGGRWRGRGGEGPPAGLGFRSCL